ncbi:MAG TPA: hypothetical protein VF646_03365 [Cytophagales bacterium]
MNELLGWVPIRLYRQDAQPMVDWCYLGEKRFTEPFFDDTINGCLRHPFNALFRHRTPIRKLAEWEREQPGIPPTGFIFHLSRCGSTLIAQMLAALPGHVVVAEAHPLDQALRAHLDDPGVTDDQRITWLRGLVSALGQPRAGGETRYFVKFDSWSTLALPLIRRAFPDVPWLFVYRDPVEVMASHRQRPGVHLVPGLLPPGLFSLDRESALAMPVDEYGARVLAAICGAALAGYGEGGGMLINYTQLPQAVFTTITGFFGFRCSPEEEEAMRSVTQVDVKNPAFPFAADAEAKQRRAGDALRRELEQWAMPWYRQLEALRLGK